MTNKFAHRLPAGWAVPGRRSSGREQRAKQSTESFRWLPSTRPSRSNESGHRWREVMAGEEPLSSKRKKEEKSWPPARLGLALAGPGRVRWQVNNGWDLSDVAAEMTHPTSTETTANENQHQLESR
jgi:hypothetical protein